MPGSSVICRFDGVTVKMYPVNHRPPHIHVEYNEFEAIIYLDRFSHEGRLPQKILNRVFDWMRIHQEELQQNWHLIERCKFPNPISPP